ncbi:MAG: c-type cytochrome [Nitratireductor sp.]|nr:c-type cytochrome [Nitratireductor sp.]
MIHPNFPKAAIVAALTALPILPAHAVAQDKNTYSTIERGLYLTRAGDCAACHTSDPEKPYAGNYPLATPFGTIHSSNLTPDDATGLGKWTADDFYKAMNEGKRPDGSGLYPAFPYTHFTLVTREDSEAIFAYLKTLEPVSQKVEKPGFPFPLNERVVMKGWNALNFDDRKFTPVDGKSAEWNRGYYLAEGLGHCAMCHSPKNMLGAEENGAAAYTGGMAEGWFAPPLKAHGNAPGLSDWSKKDVSDYLKYGRNEQTAAFGPMADVISKSTRYLSDPDLEALAAYLTDLPNTQEKDNTKTGSTQEAASSDTGKLVYDTQCAACHGAQGEGVKLQFAKLAGSNIVQSDNPTTLLRVILEGTKAVPTAKYPTPHAMPAFNWKLKNDEVVAVANYVRNAFGNSAPAVSSSDVEKLRQGS